MLIAVNIYHPNDIPARISLTFDTQESCQRALDSMTYWMKFPSFKVEGSCQKKY